MSSKNMKKRKANPISDNETPEVLVLPPKALLDKFGISLGDIGNFLDVQKSYSDGGPSNHVVKLYGNSVTSNTSLVAPNLNLNDSSIMKTASLMKKSLFLSPTFSNSNSIDSLVEDVPSIASSNLEINSSDHRNKNVLKISTPQLDSELLSANKSNAKNQDPKPLQHNNVKNEIHTKFMKNTNHSVREISPNGIDLDKSNNLTIIDLEVASFVPVPNESLTINNRTLNFTNGQDNVQVESLKKDEENVKSNVNLEDNEISTQETLLTTEHHRKCPQRLDITETFFCNNETSPQDKKIIEDSEKGILKSQFTPIADSHQKNEIVINIDKQKCSVGQILPINDSVTKVAMVLKEYLQNNKNVTVEHTLQCTSHIQGVEKPGGDKEYNFLKLKREKSPKFYTIKARKTVHKEIVTEIVEEIITDCNINLTDEDEVNEVKIFCVCSDFGSFNYYDEELEHIHFWEQKSSKCSLDVIFGIYCDDDTNSINNQNLYKECVNDKSECDYICVNEEIEFKSNDIDESQNILEPTLIEIEVPIYYDSQMTKEINNTVNYTSDENKNCELQVNISSKMQDMAEIVSPEATRKQKKRKTERDGSEGSPKIKKARNAVVHQETVSNNGSEKPSRDADSLPKIIMEVPRKREKADVTCAVCHQNIAESNWYEHVARKHSYLAWKEGDVPLDVASAQQVKDHLSKMLLEFKVLVCGKCGLERTDISKYLSHVNSCDGESAPSEELDTVKILEVVKCAQCQMEVTQWYNHIGSVHNYLAYKEGDTPVDFTDEDEVRRHLAAIAREYNGLKCPKCGCRRQFVKAYLSHVKKCEVQSEPGFDNSLSSVKCGVCQEEILEDAWIQHIEQEHNYLAWEVGETPLDLNDPEAVHNHLYKISKQIDSLVCTKCGVKRKYVKGYQTHFNQCTSVTGYTPDIKRYSYIQKKRERVIPSFDESSTVSCGVCGLVKSESQWPKHIEQEHQYLAWKFGESPIDLNNTRAISTHLNSISKYYPDGFLCTKCGKRRKCVRIFMRHIESCQEKSLGANNSVLNESDLDTSVSNSVEDSIIEENNVTCGVCKKVIAEKLWFQHIGDEHYYLAWKDTEEPLDLTDTMGVRDYLYNISQKHGQLTCKKCGIKRKYAKSFLAHIGHCDSRVNVGHMSDTSMSTSFQEDTSPDAIIKCGVCQKEMENRKWESHIRIHYYIAWKEGCKPLDTNDEQAVYAYLYDLSKLYGGLTCPKCNIKKKYVKAYRVHVASCQVDLDVESVFKNQESRDTYECAICHETGPVNKFKSHAMKEHYNVAWMVGDIPIDVRTTSSVEKYLKEYQKSHSSLVCNKCGLTRASIAGFFAHVVQCERTEEEMEMYKSVCEICNTKYLGVYKYTHMAIHRMEEAKKKLADKVPVVAEDLDVTGKRRAAQKAINDIRNISDVTGKDNDEDVEDEGEYKCPEDSSSSESEESGVSETEDQPETDVDQDLSDTESRIRNRKSTSTFSTTNDDRIPFYVKDPFAYIAKSYKDFTNTHLTSNTLFPQWLSCEYESVPEIDLPKYMPPLTESCKVQVCSKNISTYKVFEAKADKGVSMFVGATINNISWVPCNEQAHPYLAVNCYNGTDAPRIDATELIAHSGLIQIWDFKDMQKLPSFVFGLAHDFGTVWGMDWCPSGACELLPENPDNTFVRLGLLAVACSNGGAYIFSVPHPSIVNTDNLVYKLKPVAELRLFRDMSKNAQATAVTWSMQKGHSCIIVGYSNGMTAMYDLECDSPLLSCEEDGVRVFYPFHDERSHNVCVTDVKAFVSGSNIRGSVSASSCGVTASIASGRQHISLTAESLLVTPHWPSTILAGNAGIVTHAVNEVEWWGHGRRLGSMSTACGCIVCGRVAAYFPPFVKTMFLHPLYNDKRDIQVKAKIDIMSLEEESESSKGQLEPESYEEVIKMHGIKLELATNLKKHEKSQNITKPKQRNAERYPLAEVTSVSFCTVPKHHKRLAIATHSGIIFVINT
ncbi:uncharacterized protein LOC125056983 isoform X1 [Pieris napi]|uniref:uncharacterized protein LOC125056983 isoform X1 n=1 Tax=Pieris napi TaxID=78633 RepID=UPI001FBB7407|nr:uncharacterized protein LOC125056983 isoform X1 [Pieris napi]XP_047516341.1 uncharacterized protein LOC125056983 isoform X1 [Pieris napi]